MFKTAHVTMPSDREVKVERSFKAPRSLVYRAHTEPELVKQWQLGPPGWTMPICEMDVRVGGTYRWVWRSEADGSQFGFSGTYREVEPETRIVHTERYEPGTVGGEYPGEAVVTLTLAEDRGVTTLTALMDFGSKAARDRAVATGMTDGMEQSYVLLDNKLVDLGAPSSTPESR